MLAQVTATRYVTPLREGGSLPGIVEADDLGTYVMKFRGAGQGLKALVAEVVVAELARRLGFRVPELRAVTLDVAIAKFEPDEEVQDLLTKSVGLNLGVDLLPGAFGWDSECRIDPDLAGQIVWLDAFTANVDRSWRNPNLLVWHGEVWLIDHGAALYFHHSWPAPPPNAARFAVAGYDASDHVLAHRTSDAAVRRAGAELAALLSPDLLADVLDQVPDEWLETRPPTSQLAGTELLADVASVRAAYVAHLSARAAASASWLPVLGSQA